MIRLWQRVGCKQAETLAYISRRQISPGCCLLSSIADKRPKRKRASTGARSRLKFKLSVSKKQNNRTNDLKDGKTPSRGQSSAMLPSLGADCFRPHRSDRRPLRSNERNEPQARRAFGAHFVEARRVAAETCPDLVTEKLTAQSRAISDSLVMLRKWGRVLAPV
jgi:hypothetical protein